MNEIKTNSQKKLVELVDEFKSIHNVIDELYLTDKKNHIFEQLNRNVESLPETAVCKKFENLLIRFIDNLIYSNDIIKSELTEYECLQYALLIFICITWKREDYENSLKERFCEFSGINDFPENSHFFEDIFNRNGDSDNIYYSLGSVYVNWFYTDEKDIYSNIENYILNCQFKKNHNSINHEADFFSSGKAIFEVEEDPFCRIPSSQILKTFINNNKELELCLFFLLLYETNTSDNNPESLSQFETFNGNSIFINHYASHRLVNFIKGPFKIISYVFLNKYNLNKINKLREQEEIKSIVNHTIDFFEVKSDFSNKGLSEHPGFLFCFSNLFKDVDDLYLREFFAIDKYNQFYDFRMKLFQNMFFMILWNFTSELYPVFINKVYTYTKPEVIKQCYDNLLTIINDFYLSIPDSQWMDCKKQTELFNSLLKFININFCKKSPEFKNIDFKQFNGDSFEDNLAIYKILINLLRFSDNPRSTVYDMAEFAADQQKKILPLRPDRNSLFYDEHSLNQELNKLKQNKSFLRKIDCGFKPEKLNQFVLAEGEPDYNLPYFRQMDFKLSAETDKSINYYDEYLKKDKSIELNEINSKKYPRKIKFTEDYRITNNNNLRNHYIYTNERNPDAHSATFIQIEKLLDQENVRDLLSAFYDAKNILNEIKTFNKKIFERSEEPKENKEKKLEVILNNIKIIENKLDYLFNILTFRLVEKNKNPWTELFDSKGLLKTGKKGNEILDEMDFKKDFGDEFLEQIQVFFEDLYYLNSKYSESLLPQYALYISYVILRFAECDSSFNGLDFNFSENEIMNQKEMIEATRELHRTIASKDEKIDFLLQSNGERYFDNISNPEDICLYQLKNIIHTKKIDTWKMLGKQVVIKLYNWQNLEKNPLYIRQTQQDIFEEARKINRLRMFREKEECREIIIKKAQNLLNNISFDEVSDKQEYDISVIYYIFGYITVLSPKTAQEKLLWLQPDDFHPNPFTNPVYMTKLDEENNKLIITNPYDIVPISMEIILLKDEQKLKIRLFDKELLIIKYSNKNLYELYKVYEKLCDEQVEIIM